jgi:hypothetical protein
MAGNQREHIRLKMDTKVFVEVMAASPKDGGESVLVECDVVDVSFGGLKVNLDAELITGSILSICVVLPAFEDPFYLAGEVKWSRPNEQGEGGEWSAGFQLLTSSDSDIAHWRELLTDV